MRYNASITNMSHLCILGPSAQGHSSREPRCASLRHTVSIGRTSSLYIRAQSQPFSSPASPHPTPQSLANPQPPPPPKLERAGALPERLLHDYLSVWRPLYTEYDYYISPKAVYGTLPDEIRGTLFLIGPALTEAYGTAVRHPADADGMVCSLAFSDGGRIFFRNRYVRTPSFAAEQALGRRITRGMHDRGAPATGRATPAQQQQQPPQLPHNSHNHQGQQQGGERGKHKGQDEEDEDEEWQGGHQQQQQRRQRRLGSNDKPAGQFAAATRPTEWPVLDPLAVLGMPPLSGLFNPLDLNFRAPVNASVVVWGGRLLAFGEGESLPYELNKLSLETVGQYDAGGALAGMGRLVAGYKIVTAPTQPPSPSGRQQPQQPPSPSGRQQPQQPQSEPRPLQRLVLMGAAQSGPDTLLRWVELSEDGVAAHPPVTHVLPGTIALGVVDFWVTERHYVVVQVPLDFNPQRFATAATIGAASFAECFDWSPDRPARIHIVPRPTAGAARTSTAPTRTAATSDSRVPASSPTTSHAAGSRPLPNGGGSGGGGGGGRSGSDEHRGRSGGSVFTWPPKGPEVIVVDAPPLLPTSCVGCYSPDDGAGGVLVLDAVCQQGLSGAAGGTLDSGAPEGHRHQPKPELTRLVVNLHTRTATARVLSQRTVAAATTSTTTSTTPLTSAANGASAPSTKALLGPLRPVGHGASSRGGYHHIYAAAAATDAPAGWAPPQVLLKLGVPPSGQTTATAAAAPVAASAARATAAAVATVGSTKGGLHRWRGMGAEVWTPGDRVFVGPLVFVPRDKKASHKDMAESRPSVVGAATEPAAEDVGSVGPMGRHGREESKVSDSGAAVQAPMESDVRSAAGAAVGGVGDAEVREWEEQDGWLLVVVHDMERGATELCVLDAREVTRGPVAVVALPHHLPYARGAHFTRTYYGPGLAAPPGWTPP